MAFITFHNVQSWCLFLIPSWIRSLIDFSTHRISTITRPQRVATAPHSWPKDCLQGLLANAAKVSPLSRLILYPIGNATSPIEISYRNLHAQAQVLSRRIRPLLSLQIKSEPILIHLEDHYDAILCFWAVLLAGGLPVLSSPFSNVDSHREKHILSLSTLLESPLCITRESLLHLFSNPAGLRIHSLESLVEPNSSHTNTSVVGQCDFTKKQTYPDEHSAAMLMLTSGSTGNAKAVVLSHHQVLAAVSAKAGFRKLPPGKPFLNWIGMDHVASLVEIHIQAMYLGVSQVHVHASDITSSPKLFLNLLSRHQISTSFAPNFFLAKLVSTIEAPAKTESAVDSWDLRNLTVLASGGEANDLSTCISASLIFARHGAPKNVITPGFGMTETCAGAIFNGNCPEYDVDAGGIRAFASLGTCLKGIKMRISTDTAAANKEDSLSGTIGELQIRGEVVFKEYYRNQEATTAAFTEDGWFKTGDQGMLDPNGNLHLIGRVKDTINLNGVKINSADVQLWVDQCLDSRVKRAIIFASRAKNAHTEQVTVAYVSNNWPISTQDIIDNNNQIVDACMLCTGHRPVVFFVRDMAMLPQTTLGKISRAKMRILFENNEFQEYIEHHNQVLEKHSRQNFSLPTTKAEMYLIRDFAKILDINTHEISTDASIFHIGFTSMDLIRLKRALHCRLGIDIPVSILMKNPTARLLAAYIENISSSSSSPAIIHPYDPVVPLRTGGNKTPLWLFHPGVGEVLVFVSLAKYMEDDDRPVYALRARGFDHGHTPFESISETIQVYTEAIRKQQPHGTYALAGYSYGSMLAFEVAKILEQEDGVGVVQFLGCFNLPPHIKPRMRQLNKNLCLLHLAYFLGLVTETYSDNIEDEFKLLSHQEAKDQLLAVIDRERVAELGLEQHGLLAWAELAYSLQSMAVDYGPSGSVSTMDIFHARPLRAAAASRRDWINNQLSKWKDFCKTPPKFHSVGGAHYTMIGSEHVQSFSKTLKRALRERGL